MSEKLTSGSTESYITFIRNVSVSAVKYAICFTSYWNAVLSSLNLGKIFAC